MLNRSALLHLLTSAVVALPAVAQAQFEGTISMHIASVSGGSNMDYSVKGDRVRMDIATAQMAMYMLANNGAMTVVMPTQKMYLEQPIPSVMDQGNAASKVTVKATGRMETIAGYKCEHYTITDAKEGGYDACLSKELGTFMAPMSPGGRGRGAADASSDVLAHLGGNAFPLKVQKIGGATTLEVTKIEKKPLSESLFTVPSGFTKLDVGAMKGVRPPE
jgi:hypothetical protein